MTGTAGSAVPPRFLNEHLYLHQQLHLHHLHQDRINNFREQRMSLRRRSRRDSGIVGGLAALAFRAKSYLVMDGKQDASEGSNLRKSGENIQSSAAISSSEKETNSPSVSTKTKNNVVETKKEARQPVSYKKCHKTQRKAVQTIESTKEIRKETNNCDALTSTEDLLNVKAQSTEDLESIDENSETSKTCGTLRRRSKMTIKLDERSDMGKLADQIVPQLTSMQRNLLGLLFFNELSDNIVEDLVTQQLVMMPSQQFAQTLRTLDNEVKTSR